MSHKVSASYVRKANRMQSVEPWDRVGAVDKPRQEASCFIHGVWDLSVVNRCPQCPQPVATVAEADRNDGREPGDTRDIATDSIAQLRAIDLDRVLTNCTGEELQPTAAWITEQRPDLAGKVEKELNYQAESRKAAQ